MRQLTGPETIARLLQGWKIRSGLSYSTLAERTFLSRSALHRYCSGTAVPTDFATLTRIARACDATSTELLELHHLWHAETAAGPAAQIGEEQRREDVVPHPEPAPAPSARTSSRRRRTVAFGLLAMAAGAVLALSMMIIWLAASGYSLVGPAIAVPVGPQVAEHGAGPGSP
jgi:transcriptional regulator with XRE-family HTH domain